MKWFRHNSDSYTNLKMQKVISEFGMDGYAVFWLLCELVAQQGEDYSLPKNKGWLDALTLITRKRRDYLHRITQCLHENNLIFISEEKMSIPKMSEYSDDYTKRVRRVSEQSTDKVPLHNITLHNSTLSSDKSPKKKEYNPLGAEILKAFEVVDPKNKTYYGNKTQRLACDFLLSEYGIEKVLQAVKILPQINQKKLYIKQITTPYELKEGWVKIGNALRQLQDNKKEYVL
jgi:hypothetical protein